MTNIPNSVSFEAKATAQKGKLFIHIPKNAGCSFKSTLHFATVTKYIHPLKYGELVEDRIKAIGADDTYKFAFTRNPYARFYSTYKYFYRMGDDHEFFKYNNIIRDVVREYTTIEDFSKAFAKRPVLFRNFHFRTQSSYLFDKDNKIITDFLGSVERYDETLDHLGKILIPNHDVELQRESRWINKSGGTSNYRDTIAKLEKAVDLVKDYYKEDFLKLGYSFDPSNIYEPPRKNPK